MPYTFLIITKQGPITGDRFAASIIGIVAIGLLELARRPVLYISLFLQSNFQGQSIRNLPLIRAIPTNWPENNSAYVKPLKIAFILIAILLIALSLMLSSIANHSLSYPWYTGGV